MDNIVILSSWKGWHGKLSRTTAKQARRGERGMDLLSPPFPLFFLLGALSREAVGSAEVGTYVWYGTIPSREATIACYPCFVPLTIT